MTKSPDAFRTISEVADWLGVQTHVLRFWESKFTQVKPVKRAGGRRYYRPADMLLLGGIRKLLHDDGLTIKGVQKILREDGMAHVADMSAPLDDETAGNLDHDLAARIGDDIQLDSLAQAPDETSPDWTESAPDETPQEEPFPAENADQETERPAATMPSFMRAPDTTPMSAADQADPREDIPTLTPDIGPFGDEPAESDAASASEPSPVDVSSDWASTSDPESEPAQWSAEPAPEPAEPTEPEPEPEPQAARWSAEAMAEPADVASSHPEPEPEPQAESEFGTARDISESEPEPMQSAAEPPDSEPVRRPRIVDAPDDITTDGGEISPSALTKVSRLDRLTPAQRDALRPLVAQLTALRDQMARARQSSR